MKIRNQVTNSRVIVRKITEKEVEGLLLNFDLCDDGSIRYMYEEFADVISANVPEFAFAYHKRDDEEPRGPVEIVREAAKTVMKIQEIAEIKALIDGEVDEELWPKELMKRYENKGFFSEIILHFLIKELYNTKPLVSKIYFKDSASVESHGFDAVHVDQDKIWLGEAKFYHRIRTHAGEDGIKALIDDVKKHFVRDYLNEQFLIIKRGLSASIHPERQRWLNEIASLGKLSDKFTKVRVPLLCIYQSKLVIEDEITKTSFDSDYLEEIKNLKKFFDDKNNFPNKDALEIVLILLPVESKRKIVWLILDKLYHLQSV